MSMNTQLDVDWEEAFIYRAGQRVELKAKPGVFDVVANYEPDMVPPVWLVNDPIPRYPHELRAIEHPTVNSRVVYPASVQ